ncbi:hypothetical protein RclHR1_05520001 [Rhizophagus clarus]|uniref:Uncharacterized protein n=1 Tax=Rhizophagus clarus TaxID=94130 RepID=A0A2Z6RTF0_9GLOM|nr:hypothetical protein RclHR1_05520001 [Rhizophagus clarus]
MPKERIKEGRNLSLFKLPFHKTKIKRMIPKQVTAPSTQANREEQAGPSEFTQGKFIDRHARKPREHLKTWDARLRQRWFEVTGEELDLPLNLKECQRLHYDNIHSVIPVWYGKHFACQSREKCGKTKGWTPIVLLRYLLEVGILESVTIGEAIISLTKQTKVWLPKNRNISCAIIGKFTQGNKVKEKRLTHRVVIDKGELDFLIQDCIKEGTYAGSDKCPLGYILIYYEGYQPQYTHLRASIIATDSIYIRKEVLYKIENVSAFFKQAKRPSNHKGGVDTSKFQCLHKAPSCAMCEVGVYYSKEAVKKFIEEVIVHYVNRNQVYLSCNEHKPFVCAVCFREWYFRLGHWKNACFLNHRFWDDLPQSLDKRVEEKNQEIQPGQ